MRLRPALRSESAELDAIALAAKAHWGYAAAQLDVWRSSLRTDPDTVEAWPTVVAEDGGRVVGFVQANSDSDPWDLVSLWVVPDYMRCGVGSKLLREMASIAYSRGQKCIEIDSDPNAEPFYLHFGAKRVGTVPAPIPGEPVRVRPQLRLPTREA